MISVKMIRFSLKIWVCHCEKTFAQYGKDATFMHLYEPHSDEVSAAKLKFVFTWSGKTMTTTSCCHFIVVVTITWTSEKH